MASSPSKSFSPTSRPEADLSPPLVIVTHPLDPADSFVHIESPPNSTTLAKQSAVLSPRKVAPSSNLEDGWDFVESADEQPSGPNPLTMSAHIEASNSKSPKGTSPSASSSDSQSTRGSSSLPPLSSSKKNKWGSKVKAADPIQPKHLNGKQNAARPSTELTGHSGFKHRIYCSLYNLYHAQPSEAPALSSSPIYMMGAILTSSPEGDAKYGTDSAVPVQLSPSNTTSSLSIRKSKSANAVLKTYKEEFLEMCRSLVFFSYRKDFAKIDGFGVTSDVGWGCMLRTGQMLLATALQRLHEPLISSPASLLWKTSSDRIRMRVPVGHEVMTTANSPLISQLILDWFRDSPDMDRHPYSIHNLVRTSLVLNPPADMATESGPTWFSPTKLARLLRFVVRVHSPENLTMYVPPEGVVYVDEVVALCTEKHTSSMSPESKNAHQDRTYLWWKRFASNGPSISRSLTFPDYDEAELGSDSDSDIKEEDIENDVLYPRALAESIAQYESETSRSPSSFSQPATPQISHEHHHQPRSAPEGSEADLLSWTVREWSDSHSSSHSTKENSSGGLQKMVPHFGSVETSHLSSLSPDTFGSASKSAPSQYAHGPLAKSSGAIPPPRASTDSTNSLDSSSAWIQLDTSSRSNSLEALGGGRNGVTDDGLDEYFSKPPIVSYDGPLNLSSLVETHENLQGEPKPHVFLQHGTHTTPNRLLETRPFHGTSEAPDDRASSPAPLYPALSVSPQSSLLSQQQHATPSTSPYSSIESDQFGVMGATSTAPRNSRVLEDSVFVMVPGTSPPSSSIGSMLAPAPQSVAQVLPSNVTSASGPTSHPPPSSANMGSQGSNRPGINMNPRNGPLTNGSPAETESAESWRPLLLLIPSRLGVSKVNPAYVEHLKFSLSTASSVGIVGGKPNKSLYFFAFQDDYVFYLDPHFVHSTVRPVDNKGGIHDSYKVKFPQKLKFLDLDPSLALGFFIRTRSDFEAFCQAHHTFAVTVQDDPASEPIFTIQAMAPEYLKH